MFIIRNAAHDTHRVINYKLESLDYGRRQHQSWEEGVPYQALRREPHELRELRQTLSIYDHRIVNNFCYVLYADE